jgi:hypothetical protein
MRQRRTEGRLSSKEYNISIIWGLGDLVIWRFGDLVIVRKDSQPPGQSPLIQDLFAMLFRVDIAMATTEVTLSKYVKKEIARIGLELDCSAFYLHKLISYRKMH